MVLENIVINIIFTELAKHFQWEKGEFVVPL